MKLSALHPRYEPLSRERVLKELTPRLLELARLAKSYELNFTVDAEEADRLELSLEVIAAVLRDPSLAGWDGFGLAVQAYQKRAARRDRLDRGRWPQALDRRLMVRLVKGAYWDTEIKRAQERGLADYPVFTRKAMTDLCYLDCVRRLLAARPRLYPQFATHNALTVASVIEDAGGAQATTNSSGCTAWARRSITRCSTDMPALTCRVYAPVGGYADLLAYLVRRLLGERRQFVLRVGRRRSQRADRRYSQAAAKLDRRARHGAPSAHSAAARSVRAGAEEFDRRRIRRSARRSMRCWRDQTRAGKPRRRRR